MIKFIHMKWVQGKCRHFCAWCRFKKYCVETEEWYLELLNKR